MLMEVFVCLFFRGHWPSKSRVTVVTVFVPISFDFSALSGILHLQPFFLVPVGVGVCLMLACVLSHLLLFFFSSLPSPPL